MTMTSRQTEEQRIFDAMVNGTLSFEAGRLAFSQLYDSLGTPMSAASLDSLVESAKQQQAAKQGTTYTPTTTTSTTTTPPTYSTTKALTPNLQRYLGEEDPYAAWNKAGNLPSVGANPFEAWSSKQAGPAYSGFAGEEIQRRAAGQPIRTFGQYMGPQALNMGTAAQNAIAGARKMTSAGQGNWLGQLQGENIGGSLKDLLQAAMAGRGGQNYADPFTRAATANLPGYEQQWRGETAMGGVPGSPTLLEYLLKQLGL